MTLNKKYSFGGKSVRSIFDIRDLLISKILEDVFEVSTEAAIAAAIEMKDLTPRLTGRAASNWWVASEGHQPPYDPSRIGDHPVDTSGLVDPSRDTIIGNETPYLPDLELGSSDQAPHGMMRLVAQRGDDFLRNAAVAFSRRRF